MIRRYFEQLDPKSLRPISRNEVVFGDTKELPQQFLDSIQRRGIMAPIIITAKRLIADGHRRTAAAIQLGMEKVPCFVSERQTVDEALEDWRECQLTVRQLTTEQKTRLAAEEALFLAEKLKTQSGPCGPTSNPKQTAEEMAAKNAGLGSRKTLQRAAKVVEKIDELEHDGKTEEAEQLREALNTKPVTIALNEIQQKPDAEPKPKKDDETPKDGIGTVLPKNLIDVFSKRQLFADVMAATRQVQKTLDTLTADENLEATFRLNGQQAKNDLKNFLQQINFAIPHAVCPYCRGSGKYKGGGCTPCKGAGWVTKSAYKTIPEDER